MSYTFFAIACYIIMRGLQVILADHQKDKWYKYLINTVAVIMIYAALASLIVWYNSGLHFLGFSPNN